MNNDLVKLEEIVDYIQKYKQNYLLEIFLSNEKLLNFSNVISVEDYKEFLGQVINLIKIKSAKISNLVDENIVKFDSFEEGPIFSQLTNTQKSRYFLLKARLYSFLLLQDDGLSEKKELYLTRSSTLDLKNYESLCDLGEYYWQLGDFEKAAEYFRKSYQVSDKKYSDCCWKLSLTLRQSSQNRSVSSEFAQEYLNLAHESVRLDPDNAKAWELYGNTIFHLYVKGILSQSCQKVFIAFNLASKKKWSSPIYLESNFHNNLATICEYEGLHLEALKAWYMSNLLDPMWSIPRVFLYNLYRYLNEVEKITNSPPKKLMKESTLKMSQLPIINHSNMEEKTFSELQIGDNSNTIVQGRVVCSRINGFSYDKHASLSLGLCDRNGQLFIVRINSIAYNQGPVLKDIITIPNPHVKILELDQVVLDSIHNLLLAMTNFGCTEFGRDDIKRFKFPSSGVKFLNIMDPSNLMINSKKIGKKSLAPVGIDNTFFIP